MKNPFKRLGNEIMSLFGKGTVIWKVPPGVEVEPAFVHDGNTYYQFTTGYNMYYERYMAAMDRMSEIDMRCDKKYLDQFQKLLLEYLKKGDLPAIAILNENLTNLRNYVTNIDLVYNLASVWYFTSDENPFEYDYELADKKIKSWKKSKDIEAFFLTGPIMEFMPPLPISGTAIQDYIRGQRLTELLILKRHLFRASKENSNEDLISTLRLQIEELEELLFLHSSE